MNNQTKIQVTLPLLKLKKVAYLQAEKEVNSVQQIIGKV